MKLPVPKLAMIARWKPVHLGHAAVLRALSRSCEQLTIGVGSSNIIDARSPFTWEESAEMIRRVLPAPAHIQPVPDLFNGPRWRAQVVQQFGDQDIFVTANRYVRDLLKEDYTVIHPVHFLAEDERIALNGTHVRQAMAQGRDWQSLVPPEVAAYLEHEGIVSRVLSQFGAELGT